MKLTDLLAAAAALAVLTSQAQALPAFARRGNYSCSYCHANGTAHLNKTGYMYRRAGFRAPSDIGDAAKDADTLKFTDHASAGVNLDYHVAAAREPGLGKRQTANGVELRSLQFWPVVGAYLGSYGAWSEAEFSPESPSPRGTPAPPGGTTPAQGGFELAQADLRYARGTPDLFFNFRAGLLSSEGYGASDQWIDDDNHPLIDALSANFNEDTLATPLGAMGAPQLGAEFGLNYLDSHLTLGVFNGFDGTNGLDNGVQSTLSAQLTDQDRKGAKDYKVQLDQFVGDDLEFTGVYYDGRIPLLDPGNAVVWVNRYQNFRLYAAWSPAEKLELLAGGAYGRYDFAVPGGGAAAGKFDNRGGFLGANYYASDHLALSARVDDFYYAYGTAGNPRARGYALMVSLPYDNNVFVFRFMKTDDQLAGFSNDFRAEWRFLL